MPPPGDLRAGKRLLVVEEAFRDPVGHWYEYLKAAAELNDAAGGTTTIVAHSRLDPALAQELGAHALFDKTVWDGDYRRPRAWQRYLGLLAHNWKLYRLMNAFVKKHGPFDCLFAPTVVLHQLIGWRLLMARHGGRGIGQMVLLFRNNVATYAPGSDVPVFSRSSAVLKRVLQSFKALIANRRVRFVTDSGRLAHEYRLLCGIEPEVFPSPRVALPETRADVRPAGKPVTFSCLGPARFEKGIDLFQDAIGKFLVANPEADVRFVIQWNAPILDAAGAPYEPAPALLADPRVVVLRESLSSAEYDAAVADCDVMVLPYRRESYYARISGVAVEAVTAGVPLIYTRDTWCADLAAECGAGLGMDDGDAGQLLEAITAMARDYPRFAAEGRARATLAQSLHSGATFIDKLWDRA